MPPDQCRRALALMFSCAVVRGRGHLYAAGCAEYVRKLTGAARAMELEQAIGELEDYLKRIEMLHMPDVTRADRAKVLAGANGCVQRLNALMRDLAPDLGVISPLRPDEWLPEVGRITWEPDAVDVRRVQCANVLASLAKDFEDHDQTNDLSHLLTGGNWYALGQNLSEDEFRLVTLLPDVIARAARRHWQEGRYRSAVADATTALSNLVKERLGRHDIDGSKLMGEAFSDKPPEEGQPRLRCPGDRRDVAIQDQQRGAHLIAMGVIQAIRNPAHHRTGDWNAATASRMLATVGMVADWVRRWEVESVVPSAANEIS